MHKLKPISRSAIPAALEKAERYRLLNEPRDAESICRDVLRADPENQDALRMLLLALTDQFHGHVRVNVNHALELLPRLQSEYDRDYHHGVICERWAKAQFDRKAPGPVVHDWLHRAMHHYQAAEAIRPEGHDDAILRWNACARIIRRHPEIERHERDAEIRGGFEDEVPHR